MYRTCSLALILGLFGCVPPWDEDTGTTEDTGTDIVPVEDLHGSFVYVGPVGDHGWTKKHDDGRLYLEETLGVTTSYEPSVSPADTVDVVQQFVDVGADVVFMTSFDFVSQTQQAAAIHPDVSFLSCSGSVWANNLGSYMGRMYQTMYLAGMVAGYMTATDRVGLVLSVPIPEIVRHTNAFALGAREVNPDVVIEVQWVNNWFDAEVEPERPVYSIGYDIPDSCSHAEESCLTSAYWNWGPRYASIVQQIADGTWNPQDILWEQMRATPSESSVNLSDFSTLIPGTVRLAVDAKIPELVDTSGSQPPFRGPIKDSTGSTRVSSGVEPDDEALNRMCWFVEGVVTRNGDADEPAEVPAGCGGDH